jgi:hypothetical protein
MTWAVWQAGHAWRLAEARRLVLVQVAAVEPAVVALADAGLN